MFVRACVRARSPASTSPPCPCCRHNCDDGGALLEGGWVSLQGQFVSVMVVVAPCRSEMTKKGAWAVGPCQRAPHPVPHPTTTARTALAPAPAPSPPHRHHPQRPPHGRPHVPGAGVALHQARVPAIPDAPVRQGPGGRVLPVRQGGHGWRPRWGAREGRRAGSSSAPCARACTNGPRLPSHAHTSRTPRRSSP